MAVNPKPFNKADIFGAIVDASWPALLASPSLPAFIAAIELRDREAIKLWAGVYRKGPTPILSTAAERAAINAVCDATVTTVDPAASDWKYVIADAVKRQDGGMDVTVNFTNAKTGGTCMRTFSAPDMSLAKLNAQADIIVSMLDARDAASATLPAVRVAALKLV
jgi:hypothetical protein